MDRVTEDSLVYNTGGNGTKKFLIAIATAVLQTFGLKSLIKEREKMYKTRLKLPMLMNVQKTGTSKSW